MVAPQPYQSTAPAPADPWDLLEGGGKPAIKFGERDQYDRFVPAPVGTSYTGILTKNLESAQITDYDTKEPEFWDPPYNTRPKMQLIGEMQVYQPTEEDDGIRRVYFKGQMFTALQTELKEKKIGRFGVGTRLTITLVDLKPPTKVGFNPQNVYRVDVGPEIAAWVSPEQEQVDAALASVQGPVAPATPQAWAQPVAPQAPPVPQQAYQPAANPAFAGQVVPAMSAAAAAIEAIAASHQPVAAQELPLVSQEDVDGIATLRRVGLGRDQAISAYAETLKQNGVDKGDGFIAALSQAVPTDA